MMLFKQSIALAAVIALEILQSSCSATAAKDQPCERKCGARTIPGGKLRVIPLSNNVSIECRPPYDSAGNFDWTKNLGSFEFSFLLFEDRSTTNGAGTTASTQTNLSAASQTPDRVPIGNAAFYPSIVGLTAAGHANPSSKNTDTTSDQWCTDSCGIATLTVTPVCLKQEMAVGIIVPGVTGEPLNDKGNPNAPVTLTITNP